MAQLPTDPPPSKVSLSAYMPSGKARAISGSRSQAKSSGVFLWQVKFSYSLLDFDQRDELMAFLLQLSGRVVHFDVIVPTHSENSSVNNSTATCATTNPTDTSVLTLEGMSGELKKLNLIRANGKRGTHSIVEAGPVVGGSQTVTIVPPLREPWNSGDTILTKDVPLNMALDEDTITSDSVGMSATVSFTMVEEPL